MASFVLIFITFFNFFSSAQIVPDTIPPAKLLPDTIPLGSPLTKEAEVVQDRIAFKGDSLVVTPVDTVEVIDGPVATLQGLVPGSEWDQEWVERKFEFNPDPNRAVWLSALFPGLGQVYNRRYWKLPLIVGGYLGLGYATSWNNGMLKDYTRAYADLTDADPTTKSYMDFFPPTIREEDLDKEWLTNIMRSRKNYFRRNRDLCIISMVGVYLLAMVDAYVDASLAHFDITPELSMELVPSLINDSGGSKPAVGLHWAFVF